MTSSLVCLWVEEKFLEGIKFNSVGGTKKKTKRSIVNPLSAMIFTVFRHSLLEDRVLHKEAWVAKLLGTHLSI